MKIQNLLIGLFMITTGIFAYMYYSNVNDKPVTFHEDKSLFNNSKCKQLSSWRAGGVIDAVKAERRIKNYENVYKPQNDTIMAYMIELKHIETVLSQIAHYHQANSTAKKVTGLRFYNALRDTILDNTPTTIKDLVMVPVFEDGCDFYKIYKELVPVPMYMYSYFRPCPRICGSFPIDCDKTQKCDN